MKYFDSHCHLNGQFYEKENVTNDLINAVASGVNKIILPGTDKADSLLAIEMAKNNANVYAAAGVHPSDAKAVDVADFLNDINPIDIVAVGECGLDLHYEDNQDLETQIIVFEKHIEYAKKNNLPLIVHSRDAVEHTYEVLKRNNVNNFVMHAYSESLEWANKFIELGGYISFTGVITFKNAESMRDVARNIPLDRIICETDAPFLTPVPFRGKPNKPEYVKHVVDAICKLRNEGDEIVANAIYENTCRLFNIK